METKVNSRRLNTGDFEIIVKVCSEDNDYDDGDEFEFESDNKLNTLSCIHCENDKYLEIATKEAIKHLFKLRSINKVKNTSKLMNLCNYIIPLKLCRF